MNTNSDWTVQQLINQLKQYHPDMKVMHGIIDQGQCLTVETFDISVRDVSPISLSTCMKQQDIYPAGGDVTTVVVIGDVRELQ